MTSHLLYTQWDATRPASQSPIVIQDIILSHEARIRSYELLAQAFELSSSPPATA